MEKAIKNIRLILLAFIISSGQMVSFGQRADSTSNFDAAKLNLKNTVRFGFYYAEGIGGSVFTLSYEREIVKNFSLNGTVGYGWNYGGWILSRKYHIPYPIATKFMGMIQPKYYFALNSTLSSLLD